MANSKYEYVKSYEVEDEIFLPNLIVVRIGGRDFRRFAEVHEFEKPNDEIALNLMNSCAVSVSEEFPDIVFSYGFSEEFSFIFKKTSKFHQRRARSHTNNLCNTCLWELIIKGGKTESEALELLKVIDVVKHNKNGSPVRRLRKKLRIVHSKNIAGISFWNKHKCLLNELGSFSKDIGKVEPDFLKSFQFEKRLTPSTWIVIRIDGCHFHRFSDVHEFVKPNDEQALKLMNSCAVAVVKEFQDTVFAYGVSDEYSFVLKKDSQFYQRRASKIVSVMVSLFTSMYTMKWKDFFPDRDLKYPPYFDGRAVYYPSSEILRDYLAWRQVDCHINNQYNTCFWQLVKSGKSKSEAQNFLKGTLAGDKDKLLKQFGIDYSKLPVMFRQGSSTFWDKGDIIMTNNNKPSVKNSQNKVVTEHCNIIESSFWCAHPTILNA
ncbi:hypothetical protein ABKV19_008066 [Rosa sericea]